MLILFQHFQSIASPYRSLILTTMKKHHCLVRPLHYPYYIEFDFRFVKSFLSLDWSFQDDHVIIPSIHISHIWYFSSFESKPSLLHDCVPFLISIFTLVDHYLILHYRIPSLCFVYVEQSIGNINNFCTQKHHPLKHVIVCSTPQYMQFLRLMANLITIPICQTW